MASPRPPAVLIVENESIAARDLQQALASLGYDAYAIASSAEQALARASEKRPDVVLVDIRMAGGMDAIQALQHLKRHLDVPVIYLAAHADDMLQRVKQTRPQSYLLKPVKRAELKKAIEIAIFRSKTGQVGPPVLEPAATLPSPATMRPGRAAGVRAVRRQVEQVFSSADFDAARRSREFLRFIVDETLAGRGEDLTQLSIATKVFGRREDFDAMVDPIVRIQAGRLRRSLERYYMLSGKDDAVRIDLRRGTYIPTFRAQPAREAVGAADRDPEPAPPAVLPDDWPSVAISAFGPLTPGANEAAACVTEELVLELGRYRAVRALLQNELEQHQGPGQREVRFALGGRLRVDPGGLRVTTHLVDRASGEQVWGDEYHTVPEADRRNVALEDIGRVIAARVGAEEGVVVQILAAEHRKRRPPATITPFGAVLLSFDFFLTRDPMRLAPALEALREVVSKEPDCGIAWTWLARVCLANYAFEVTSIPTPIDDTIAYAQQGVRLEQTSRRARCILASALLARGEVAAARAELEDALRLSSDSLAWLEIIGYLLTLAGDWTRGPALIRTARRRNPHCLPNASMGLWFDHMRRGEMELAYQHALELRDPIFFWRGAMRASCLGHLERPAEARSEVAELLRRKPDFQARGRVLIGHYVKYPEVMDRVVAGLAKAGLTLA